MQRRDYGLAIADFSSALELDPKSPAAQHYKSSAERMAKQQHDINTFVIKNQEDARKLVGKLVDKALASPSGRGIAMETRFFLDAYRSTSSDEYLKMIAAAAPSLHGNEPGGRNVEHDLFMQQVRLEQQELQKKYLQANKKLVAVTERQVLADLPEQKQQQIAQFIPDLTDCIQKKIDQLLR